MRNPKTKNYYAEIDKALSAYERGMYATHKISWITSRIDWCFRWHKITRQQMLELADRAIAVMPLAEI